MTNTRDKLNEAKFFLEKMTENVCKPNHFRYMFSAFLASSRSITFIMQKEFVERNLFSEWYKKKRDEIKNNQILKYMLKQRNLTYHQRPILQYPVGVTEFITENKRTSIVLTGTGSSIPIDSNYFMILPRLQPKSGVKYYFDDFMNKEKDVISICKETILTIENIVNECESKFCKDNTSYFDFK